METLFSSLEKLLKGAENAAALSATGVWALFCFLFIMYIFYDLRQKKNSSERTTDMRLEEARADALMASAIEKLANEIKELRYRMDALQIGGGSHVPVVKETA